METMIRQKILVIQTLVTTNQIQIIPKMTTLPVIMKKTMTKHNATRLFLNY